MNTSEKSEKGIRRKLTPEEEEGWLRLEIPKLSSEERKTYNRLIFDKRAEEIRQYGKPTGQIPLEIRLDFLRLARSCESYEGAIRALRMRESWEKATSKDGRPPIGGAQDD